MNIDLRATKVFGNDKMVRIVWFITLLSIFAHCDEPNLIQLPGEEERAVFKKMALAMEAIPKYWQGYDIRSTPLYITFKANGSLPARGYLLNVPDGIILPEGTIALDGYETFGLNLFRNDQLLQSTAELVHVGGGFSFPAYVYSNTTFITFEHVNTPGSLTYLNFKIQDNNWIPLFSIHELFHIYQMNENWNRQGQKFDVAGYPFNRNLLTFYLYLWELTVDAYSLQDIKAQDDFLKYYVVLKTAMKDLDITDEQLVTSMGDYQELLEGTARYIEHFVAAETYFPTISQDPTHGWSAMLNTNPSKNTIRNAFSHRMGYHVGAIVTKILFERDLEVIERYRNGETPYQLALDYLKLNEIELQSILSELVSRSDWQEHAQQADALMSILEN
jgi:hypothetical protein